MRRLLLAILLLCMAVPVFAQGDVVRVTNLRDVIEDYFGASSALSPDGTMVGYIHRGDNRLCVLQTADFELTCTPFPEAARRVTGADRIAWSPDSAKIAITEEFLRRLDEADIWVFDVAAQTFTNLTDDGTDVSIIRGGSENALTDLFPVWSSAGDLYFQRIQNTVLGRLVTVQRIPGGTGEPEQAAILGEFFFAGLGIASPVISPDGTQMAIAIGNRNGDDNYGGVYLIDLETGLYEQLIGLDGMRTGTFFDLEDDSSEILPRLFPVALAWLNDEALLLGRDMSRMDIFPTGVIYNYIDIAAGTATPVMDLSDFEAPELFTERNELPGIAYQSYYPFFAMLNADGSRLYYASRQEAEGDNKLLSLELPPTENTPSFEFLADFPPLPGLSNEDALSQISDDGRYGLYSGYYLIEFATDSE